MSNETLIETITAIMILKVENARAERRDAEANARIADAVRRAAATIRGDAA
jgi:hypothetical protein